MFRFLSISFLCSWFIAPVASAHEVYVLSPDKVALLESQPAVPFFDIVFSNLSDTLIWGSIIGFLIISVFLISISATLENKFDGTLIKLKHFAPFISRVTIGLAFMFCAYEATMFGPELPFSEMFYGWSFFAQIVFAILGVMMIFGIYTRTAGLLSLGLFGIGLYHYGFYMVTYTNYLAEMLVLILIGSHKFSVTPLHTPWWRITKLLNYLTKEYGEFAFMILRIGFGVSLIYASVYAKIIHNQLALAVVNDFNLVSVFGFTPEFIVLGAAIIEILLGLFIILGIEIRFNAIVLNIFLTLSLIYFGEAVWPHIILIGLPIAFFCYGYDKYSLEGYFFKKGNREPIF